MLQLFDCIRYEHDLNLVAVSAAICIIGTFTAVLLGARARMVRRGFWRWIISTSTIFGFSVWSLHFVAMLSFLPAANTYYDIARTSASLIVIIALTVSALCVFKALRLPAWRSIAAGALLGLGISGMHYTGVSGLGPAMTVLYDPRFVASSVFLAIGLSTAAFHRSSVTGLQRFEHKIEMAAWLSAAICSLHFTGMTGITILRNATEPVDGVLGSNTLAFAVGAVSLSILACALIAIGIEAKFASRSHRELQRMRLMNNLSREVLIVHHHETIIEVNQAAERLFGMTASELIGRAIASLFHPDSVPALVRRASCPAGQRIPEEMSVMTVDGREVVVEISCQSIELLGKHCTAVAMRDLTDRKRDEERITYLARHDAVTGLPNRFKFDERLREAIDAATFKASQFALFYIDLDRFKSVNDLYGHGTGDAVLREVAARISLAIDPTDTVARIGGDEFAAIVNLETKPLRVAEIANELLYSLSRPIKAAGKIIPSGCSLGIAIFPLDAVDAEALMSAADTAMYRVKAEGRGSLRFFEASMNDEAQSRYQLENDLRAACTRREFVLFYQPMVNAESGHIETCEALIRWNCPSRGLVPPSLFIPIAEETGLITDIGAWVIDAAICEAARWLDDRRVSINVSAKQIRNSDVYAVVKSALDEHGLSPNRLVVEITESVLISDTARTVTTLQKLRGLGVRIALDDFGTGYSSLSYLQRFKFDKIKIDKSFVDRIAESADAVAIIRAIVQLAHNLDLQVTAEGVETDEQLSILRSIGCDQVQGYLLSRPQPYKKIEEMGDAAIRSHFLQSSHLRRAVTAV